MRPTSLRGGRLTLTPTANNQQHPKDCLARCKACTGIQPNKKDSEKGMRKERKDKLGL